MWKTIQLGLLLSLSLVVPIVGMKNSNEQATRNLFKAAKKGDAEKLKQALGEGANASAIREEHGSIVSYQNEERWTPLHYAAQGDYAHIAKLM